MKTLQDILNDFNKSNTAKLSNKQIAGRNAIEDTLNKTAVCPNCKSTGRLATMKLLHFNNCPRPAGYSNQVIIDKFVNGMMPSQISVECGITDTSVRRILAKMGHKPVDKLNQDKEDIYQQIVDLRKQGYTIKNIQKTLKVSNNKVYKALETHGLYEKYSGRNK